MNKTYLSLAIAISLLLGPITQIASAQVHVNGYTRRDGTYVAPHWRSAPDSTPTNNYSTQGNYNPYTGQAGTVNPYSQNNSYSQQNYGNSNNQSFMRRSY